MGMLDNVLNGLGGDAAGGVGDLLRGQGGVGGLVEKFNQAGLADVVGSWIGTGANANISAEQITAVGRDVECVVLARAVRWHVERRVLMNGHKTVIFK